MELCTPVYVSCVYIYTYTQKWSNTLWNTTFSIYYALQFFYYRYTYFLFFPNIYLHKIKSLRLFHLHAYFLMLFSHYTDFIPPHCQGLSLKYPKLELPQSLSLPRDPRSLSSCPNDASSAGPATKHKIPGQHASPAAAPLTLQDSPRTEQTCGTRQNGTCAAPVFISSNSPVVHQTW